MEEVLETEEKVVCNYKKLNEEYEGLLFKNYNLTDLMLLEKNGRKKKANENSALYELLRQKLEEYGIGMFGAFKKDGLMFRCVRLFEGFPLENEPIIKQLYGYNNFEVHIQLNGYDGFSTAFDYNTDTGKCELQRHSWGSVTHRIKYDSLKDMLKDIDFTEEGYDKIFGL